MNKNINITLIADEGYLVPTCVAIASIIENRDKDYFYHIYVVMPKETPESVSETIESSGKGAEGIEVIVKKIGMEDLHGLHNDHNNKYLAATETALLKFKLPEIFSDIDKMLYLDGDILVLDSLVELYECDMEGKSLAAVRDLPQVLYDKQVIGKDINGQDYFNSGVMLLDLAKMRANNSMNELIEVKRKLEDYSLMDQNVFNIVFANDVLQLPFLYNVCYINLMESAARYKIEKLNSLYNVSYKHPCEIISDIKIMHFSSKLKPWLFYDVPLADRWIYYYKKSVLGNIPLQRVWHTKRNVNMAEIKEQVKRLSNTCEEDKKIIPVVFATNKDYAPYVAVAIQSIYECSSAEYFYDINILIDASMTNNLKEKFNKLLYPNMTIRLWDVRKCFEGVNLYSVGHYSRQMYFRWLIPEIFSKYDKVLYLDCDLVVRRNIGELYETNIHDNYIGAINNFLRSNLENYVKNKLGLSINQYYNSGVLLINTKEFILNDVKNKCIALLREKDKLACPDQDVINIVCKGKVSRISDEWNFQWHHQFPDACKGDFVENYKERYNRLMKGDPAIIHYTSFVKPWNNPDRPYADIFWMYCRKTSFYEEILFGNLLSQTQKMLEINKVTEQKNIQEKKEIKDEVAQLRYQLEEIRKSKSYRIGHFITLIPRWLRHIFFHRPM